MQSMFIDHETIKLKANNRNIAGNSHVIGN